MAASVNLGVIFGSVRIGLSQLQEDIAAARDLLSGLQDTLGTALGDAMSQAADATAAAGDQIATSATDAADQTAMAADEMSTAEEDAATSAEDSGSRISAIWESVQEKLSAFAEQAGEAFARVGESGSALSESLGALGEKVDGLGEKLGEGRSRAFEFAKGMLEFQALSETTNAVGEFASSLIGMNEQFETLHQQLSSITGSSGQADQIIAWVKQFGQQVPDTTEHLAQAVVTIQSLGLNAEQVVPSIANVAAAMGTDLPTAAQAFGDAYEGRFQMMQMELHVTKSQLEDFGLKVSKTGKVDAASLVSAFEKLSKAKFGHAIQNQMQTLKGQLSNLTDRVQFFAMNLGKPLFDMAKQGLGAIFAFLDKHQAQINAFADIVGHGLVTAFKLVGQVIGDVVSIAQRVVGAFSAAFSGGNKHAVDQLGQAISGALPFFQGLFSILQASLVPILTTLGAVLGTALRWVVQFALFLESHHSALIGFGAAVAFIAGVIVGPLVASFVAWAISAGTAAVATIAATAPVLLIAAGIGLLVTGIVLLVKHWNQITAALTRFVVGIGVRVLHFFNQVRAVFAALGPTVLRIVGRLVSGVVGFFASLPGKVIGALVGFVQGIIHWFQHLFDRLVGHSIVTDLISGIVGLFLSLPGKILGGLASFIGKVIGFFLGLPGKALGALGKLVSGVLGGLAHMALAGLASVGKLVGGIVSGIGHAAASVASGVGHAVGGFFSFLGNVTGISGIIKKASDEAKKHAKELADHFKQLKAQAETHTAQMKVKVLEHLAAMHVQAAAHLEAMKNRILAALAHMKDGAAKRALEARLAVVNHAIAAQVAAAKQYELLAKKTADALHKTATQGKQHAHTLQTGLLGSIGQTVAGWLAKVNQLHQQTVAHFQHTREQALVHAAALRIGTLQHIAAMHLEAAKHLDQMRQEIVAQLARTKDGAARHALEMKLAVVTSAEQTQKEAAVKSELMAKQTAEQMRKLVADAKTHATSLHDSFMGPLGKLSDDATTKMRGLSSQASTILGGLGPSATTWGQNLIGNLTAGIRGGSGGLGGALTSVAQQIKNILGFHSPAKEGPGAEADQWAPNFMKMFASGLRAGTPGLLAAAKAAATQLQAGLAGAGTPGLALAGAGALTGGGAGLGGPVHHHHETKLYLTVEVAAESGEDEGENVTPEVVGTRFGTALGQALDLTLAKHGHR